MCEAHFSPGHGQLHRFIKLMYCSTVWFNTSSSNIKKLQAIHNFACRIATHSRKFEHITPVLPQLKCLPAEKLVHYRDIFMIHKCVNCLALDHEYLCSRFQEKILEQHKFLSSWQVLFRFTYSFTHFIYVFFIFYHLHNWRFSGRTSVGGGLGFASLK